MVHPKSVIEDSKIFTAGYVGICANCNHINECSFRQKSNKPVWYCDQYDAFTKSERQIHNRDSPQNPNPSETETEIFIFKGLCVNCEKRFGCVYAKTNGGIWHCNDYT
jgi:transcription elongation factor Elf1